MVIPVKYMNKSLSLSLFLSLLLLLLPQGYAQGVGVVPCEEHNECFKYAVAYLSYLCQPFPSVQGQKICTVTPQKVYPKKCPIDPKTGGELCPPATCGNGRAICPQIPKGKLECHETTYGAPGLPEEGRTIPICVVIDQPSQTENILQTILTLCKENTAFSECAVGAVCRSGDLDCYLACAVKAGCLKTKLGGALLVNCKMTCNREGGAPPGTSYDVIEKACFYACAYGVTLPWIEEKKIATVTPQPTYPEQECPPNKEYDSASKKCICKKGYYNDLQLDRCVTSEEFSAQCRKVVSATFDPKTNRCLCPTKDKPYASGFTNKCETKQDFANQICGAKISGSQYDENQKKCVKLSTLSPEQACQKRINMRYVSGKCICKEGFYQDLKLGGCVTSSELKNQCNRVSQASFDPKTNTCACPKDKPYASGFTNTCETKQDFANQVCDSRKSGTIYEPNEKKCKEKTTKTCDKDNQCPDNQKCNIATKKCEDVICDCGEIKNHECKKYDCCEDNQCGDDKRCDQDMNICTKVSCPSGSVVKNHKCQEGCTKDEQCKDNEVCKGNKCIPTTCTCGVPENHACKPYECCDDSDCVKQNKVCDNAAHSCVTKDNVCYLYEPSTGNIKELPQNYKERKGLNLIIVPDRYTLNNPQGQEEFFQHVRLSYKTFFDIEPYKTYAGKVNAYIVKKAAPVGCFYRPPTPPTPDYDECDAAEVFALAENCPISNWQFGFAYVLTKLSPSRGAAHGRYAVGGFYTRGNGRTYTLIHEASHLLGLVDEYISYNAPAPSGETPANLPNCDLSPCTKWKDFPDIDCAPGCTYTNWYRPKQKDTIMGGPLTEIGTEFDSVSTAHLKKTLEELSK